jgi:hypothetical protein
MDQFDNQSRENWAVARVNLALFGTVAAGSAIYSVVDGVAHYAVAAAFAAWCIVVQITVARPRTARGIWRLRRLRANILWGLFGTLVMLSLVVPPVFNLLVRPAMAWLVGPGN